LNSKIQVWKKENSTSAMPPVKGIIAVADRVYADPTQINDDPPPKSCMIVGSAIEMLACE
jgi:hypothetical protein